MEDSEQDKIKKQIENYCDKINLTPEIFDVALEQVVEKTKNSNNKSITVLCLNKAARDQVIELWTKSLEELKLKK